MFSEVSQAIANQTDFLSGNRIVYSQTMYESTFPSGPKFVVLFRLSSKKLTKATQPNGTFFKKEEDILQNEY